jgi:hypothetical protein
MIERPLHRNTRTKSVSAETEQARYGFRRPRCPAELPRWPSASGPHGWLSTTSALRTPAWTTICRFAAWTFLIALAVVTIGPISQRPLTSLPANLERLIAWLCAGIIFAEAYADRLLLLLLLLVGTAGLLEVAQMEVLQRHGRWSDFLVKAAGTVIGIGSVRAMQYLRSAK